jgi:hypothetical protein
LQPLTQKNKSLPRSLRISSQILGFLEILYHPTGTRDAGIACRRPTSAACAEQELVSTFYDRAV